MRASMRGVYLISAADHTSVKCRRRPTAPSCTSQSRTCAVDGDGVGTVQMQSEYVHRHRPTENEIASQWH